MNLLSKRAICYSPIYKKFEDFTMMSEKAYLDTLELVDKMTISSPPHKSSAVIECGTWKGGMIAGIASVLRLKELYYDYYLFDSFEGLPVAQEIDGKEALDWQKDITSPYYYDNCQADEKDATDAMLISETGKFFIEKGWFPNRFNDVPDSTPVVILRIDADWYDSTLLCLEKFFPLVVPGGLILFDDYYRWDGCTKAIYKYFSDNQLSERLCHTRWGASYIIKGRKYGHLNDMSKI